MRQQLRQAFGSFATGVTVVTTVDDDGQPVGFTANSFTSVSMDPPLLLVCLAKTSSNLAHFNGKSQFAVNILSETQKNISGRFASRIPDRFADTAWRKGPLGSPIIDDTVAWFECAPHDQVDAGDHIILIGRIEKFSATEQRPLAYLRGHYLDLSLGETAVDSVSMHGGVRVGCVLDCLGQVLLEKAPDGWALPMGAVRPGFREARAALGTHLVEGGIAADIGFLYSVFDAPSGNATWMIFQAEIEQLVETEDMRLFALDALPLDEIAVRQVRSVLGRYQRESKEARFGLYVDDPQMSGQINQITRKTTSWAKYMSEQENGS
jgi:flavin reductase (DIM6/NTAB) family NADH-FMN oxidoreductase RutF